VIGQQKGDDTDSRIKHNFGMPRPEGYRKAQRLMKLADRFICRWSPWSTRRAPIRASTLKRADRPKPFASSIDTCLFARRAAGQRGDRRGRFGRRACHRPRPTAFYMLETRSTR